MELFETATLLESLKEVKQPTNFLSDRYFPTSPNKDVFKTNRVLIEYKKGAKKVAPFISPRSNGVSLERYGSYMREYIPPVVGMKRSLSIDNLEKRGFGEALYQAMTPAEREATLLVEDMADLRDVIKRRQEVMAAEVIFKNALVMKIYNEDFEPTGEENEIKYYDGVTNPAVYTPAADWTTTKESGKQIISDLKAMIKMLSKRGIPATEVLMAPDVAEVFSTNEYFMELLDNRRIELGTIDPKELPDGVTNLATMNIGGRNINFLSYDEEYFDEETKENKSYIPAGYIALLAPACGHTLYGGITQMEKDEKYHTYAGDFVPRYLADVPGNTKAVVLRSAPLPVPHQESPWVVAQVIKG